ncbi:MAG: formate dehydrogenase subunit alpha, partial [Gammaproteobacteria bacterium]|nr:formate dehydrogenase subunit alpha [Gammaproteobacteria bacterium]
VMELYISDHPLDCLTCPANGDCELQDMAGAVGLRDVRYGMAGENHLHKGKDESNPYFTFDASKCIVCSRCVRACSEVQGTFALTIAGRGFGSEVSPSEQQPFLESECVSCGACVQACPTATLQEKSVINLGVPSRKVKTTCAYCGVGCSFTAELRGDEVVRMVPDKQGCANAGHSCVKGVCHSPTGYGLKQTFGTSAGTQDFASVAHADMVMVIGANPTDAHPVFASRMKRRLREGADLIVIDPRSIDLVRSPHIHAEHHLQLMPGTNVAVLNAISHVVATEGLIDEAFVAERCNAASFRAWVDFIRLPENSPEQLAAVTGVDAESLRAAARAYATAGNAAIYYGLGVTEHSQGSTMVIAMANLAMATGNIGRLGVGVNPLRGQNNVQGSCDMGSFPHEFVGYRHVSDDTVRDQFSSIWGVTLREDPGMRIPNMLDSAVSGDFKGIYIQGEDIAQSDPNTQHVAEALTAMDCVIVQDLFLNETSQFAHVFLPGTSFLEKDGTFTNAERRINRVRPVMTSRTGLSEWEATCALSEAMGYPMPYDSAAQIMDEIAALTPTFAGVSFDLLDRLGSVQWPCNEQAPTGTPIMHKDGFVRGEGQFLTTPYVPTDERSTRKFPLLLTTGRILSQYNVGAQTRRTDNVVWHAEDVLDIHEADAEARGIGDGDWVEITSRAGRTRMRVRISDDIPVGVVYTTFHHPVSGTNVITTDNSDWATNCPEYKVTAVEIRPSSEQRA